MFLKWDGSGSERKEVDGEKQRCTRGRLSHIWFCHGVTQRKKMIKNDKKHSLNIKTKDILTIINPSVPVTPQHGYMVCCGVAKTKTVPVPAVPILKAPRVYPYPF